MPAKLHEIAGGRVVEVPLRGKLTSEDYERFVPELERLIREHGKARLLVDVHDFRGWDIGALWEDVKFDLKHFNDIDRLAIVGDSKWHKAMSAFCRPFTTAQIRYYDRSQIDEARSWLQRPGS